MCDLVRMLSEHTEENAETLRSKIKFLIKERNLFTQASLLKDAHFKEDRLDDLDPTKFSRWLNGNSQWSSLGRRHHEILVRYLFAKGYLGKGHGAQHFLATEDHFFYSAADFLKIAPGTLDNTTRRMPGDFKLFRPAIIQPNKYIVSKLSVWVAEESQATCAKLFERYSGSDGSRPKKYAYDGYFLRKSQKYLGIFRDAACTGLQVMAIPDTFREEYEISSFSGVIMGMFGARPFTCRVYAERIEHISEADLDVFGGEDIPPSVLARLHGEDPSSVVMY